MAKQKINLKSVFIYGLGLALFFLLIIDIKLHFDSNKAMDRCLKLGRLSSETRGKKLSVDCSPGVPCEYPDEYDLRVIVMTYNRAESLKQLLHSLGDLEIDEEHECASLEIWIDRSKSGEVHQDTVKVAQSYHWPKGQKRVHIQKKHAGIYGQWIDTWRPRKGSNEVALFLEDDLSVSKYTWKWLKAVHNKYGNDSQCFGYTLQSEQVIIASSQGPFRFPPQDTVFMYKLIGSWGFAPTASVWRDFQDWFHKQYQNQTSFRPYVNGLVMTSWYKNFEKKHTQDSMWTMWFIYYINQRNLYCVFNNLKRVTNNASGLCVHRAEPGLHYHGKARKNTDKLLMSHWSDSYVKFPSKIKKYGFNGKLV